MKLEQMTEEEKKQFSLKVSELESEILKLANGIDPRTVHVALLFTMVHNLIALQPNQTPEGLAQFVYGQVLRIGHESLEILDNILGGANEH